MTIVTGLIDVALKVGVEMDHTQVQPNFLPLIFHFILICFSVQFNFSLL